MRIFKTESLSVLSIASFRSFIMARFFLTLAVQMQFATIYLQVYYEYTSNELYTGLIGLSEAIPFIFMSFFSGHFSDTKDRRKLIILCILILTVGAIFLFLNSWSATALFKSLGLTALFGSVVVFGIVRAFLSATTHPFMSQLVPRHLYTHSTTWNSTVWHLGAILGPVLSGLLYGYGNGKHAEWCHGLNGIFFLIAAFLIIRIPGVPKQVKQVSESIWESTQVGLRFVFTNKLILSALSLDLFAVLFGGVVAIIPAFTDKILHLGPEAYGLLRTAPAIGAVCMAGIMFIKPPRQKAGMALLFSVALFGAFTILFAFTENYWLAFTCLLLTGAFDNVSVIVRHSIMQLATPDHMRGRVSAVNGIFIGSSNEIGAFESGFAARLMGLIPSIVFGGCMTISVVGIVSLLNPRLKTLNLRTLENQKI
ncbi:MAG: MFS transporter [Sediminibacterium sp.]|nr:MFS transporter [Sediminibacterium sp.]